MGNQRIDVPLLQNNAARGHHRSDQRTVEVEQIRSGGQTPRHRRRGDVSFAKELIGAEHLTKSATCGSLGDVGQVPHVLTQRGTQSNRHLTHERRLARTLQTLEGHQHGARFPPFVARTRLS